MTLLRFFVVVLVACACSGCLRSATVMKVKADGSGTIEQTMLANPQALKALMQGMGGGGQVQSKQTGILDEAEFKRAAERMGVKAVSLTPVKDAGFEGATALFAFDDIRKVKIDQNPSVPGGGAGLGSQSAKSPINFDFSRTDGRSVLTVTVDDTLAGKAAKEVPPPTAGTNQPLDPAILGMVKTMFQGMKIGIDLEVEGAIVKTNADYVSGSRVTLLELDMNTLLQDESKLLALQPKIGPGMSISDVRTMLKGVNGVKINHPSVTIEFR